MRIVLGYVIAVALMLALGAFTTTQYDLSALAHVGAPVSMDQRMSMGFSNIVAMAPIYGGLIAIAFLIGFAVASLTVKPFPLPRPLIYAAAGLVAIATLHILTEQVFFGVPIISGTRSLEGLIAQAALGALAGLAFALISRPKPRSMFA